ncbi:TPA: hypothetical protein JG946_003763 [Enterobacter hormaechei subsp. steigerwaltii]|nr:hypothetical protein [Enterobacter hormaechei subsp. steigerwaltii]
MATFSNNIKITDVSLSSTVPQYSQRSWTGTELRRSVGIQYYTLKFTLNAEIANRQEIQAFIAEYQQGKPFTLSLGHMATYNGTQTGAITVSTATSKGSLIVPVSTNTLRVGDLIQFTNHKKLYQVMEKTSTGITVFPQLRQNVQANEAVVYNNLVIEARLDVDQTFDMGVSMVTSVQFNATENL